MEDTESSSLALISDLARINPSSDPSPYFEENERVHHDRYGNGVVRSTRFLPDGSQALWTSFDEPDGGRAFRAFQLSDDVLILSRGWRDIGDAEIGEAARRVKRRLFGDDLTADEVAFVLDLDRTTILRYLRDGVVVGYQVGREWRVPADEIEAYKQRMVASRRLEAQLMAKMTEVEAKKTLLERTFLGKSWHAGICMHCQEPILMEWTNNQFFGYCSQCEQNSYYVPPEESDAGQEDDTEFANLPF